MELETVLYRVEGNVGIVSLNRTKALNAMSKQIFVDLTTAFDAAEKDDTVRCVVVNAEGRAFCAGGDIPEMKGLDNPEAVFDFYNVAGHLHEEDDQLCQAHHHCGPRCHRRCRHLPAAGRRHRPGL